MLQLSSSMVRGLSTRVGCPDRFGPHCCNPRHGRYTGSTATVMVLPPGRYSSKRTAAIPRPMARGKSPSESPTSTECRPAMNTFRSFPSPATRFGATASEHLARTFSASSTVGSPFLENDLARAVKRSRACRGAHSSRAMAPLLDIPSSREDGQVCRGGTSATASFGSETSVQVSLEDVENANAALETCHWGEPCWTRKIGSCAPSLSLAAVFQRPSLVTCRP